MLASTTNYYCQNLLLHHNQPTLINTGSRVYSWRKQLLTRGVAFAKDHYILVQKLRRCGINHRKKLCLMTTLAADPDNISAGPSFSDVVRKFYSDINKKDLKQLEDLLSDNCFVEDSSFPYSFQGKKDVMRFFSQLAESMGEHVNFRIGTVCEAEELTASVDWHLEWKEDQIPFSRGCSIFHFSIEDDRLVIRSARIITESPIKPGRLAVGFLKMLASLFDEFPKAANWFLKSQQTIFQAFVTTYNIFLSPVVKPVLAFYITLWRLFIRLLRYLISTLHIVAKFLNNKPSADDPDNSSTKPE